jgi:hypothetical protein
MPCDKVARKVCPGELIFDPRASSSRTVIVVPAGIMTGCGAGAGALAVFALFASEPVVFDPLVFEPAVSEPVVFEPVVFEPL